MEENSENRENQQNRELPEEKYEPRPAGEVWRARIGLVLFLGFVIYQIVSIARGFR